MRKFLFLFTMLMLCGVFVFAQQRTVTGKVIDQDGNALEGITVQVEGSGTGTSTNDEGNFSIDISRGSILVFSGVGFETQRINTRNTTVLSVVMSSSAQNLSEVVVTALGIQRQERSLGYTTQQVSKSELENARASNLVDALAGKVAGVQVNQQSGGLGSSSKIIIRGASSFDKVSSPLFVVDGVPISNSAQGPSNSGISVDYGNRASDINPDDIESMTVLKGPAATAQYGSLAKDGAIIIVTKRGSKNSALSVDVNSSLRVESILKMPHLQDEYAQGNFGIYSLKYANGWGPKISDMAGTTVKDYLGRDVTLTAHPNNLDEFFLTGVTSMDDISLSGGNAQTDYRVGVNNLSSKGIVLNQVLDRYGLTANVGHKFNEKISSRFTFNYINATSNGRPVQSSNDPNVLTSAIYGVPITVDMNDLKKNYVDEFGNQNNMTTDKDGNNPFWILNRNKNGNKLNRFFGSNYLEYKITDGLTLTENLGYDIYTENRLGYMRSGTAGKLQGSYSTTDILQKRINNDVMLTFQKDLTEDINLRLMAGQNILDRQMDISTLAGENFLLDEGSGVFRPGNVEKTTPNRSFTHSRLIGVYGEAAASYKNMLYLSVTGRNDWASSLVFTGDYSYFYPSVSGSFVFTELLQNRSFLNYGKIRASWAQVGSDADPYSTLLTYTPLTTYFVQFSLPGSFPFLGNGAFGLSRILPSPDLRPQIATSREIGAELRMWGDRIGIDFTYYDTKTRDQIMSITVPASTGFFVKQVNAGSITNKGVELMFRYSPLNGTNSRIKWDIVANFSHNDQIVNKLDGELHEYSVQSGWSGLQIKAPEGKGFGLYGTKWKRAPDGQFIINKSTGLRELELDQYIGDINPKYLLGISNNISYKGFRFGFLVDIRQGGVFYSGTVAALRSSGMAYETMENRDAVFVDKGVNENSDHTYTPNETPVQSMQDFWGRYAATANTEGNVFDASFVKLREVTLAYDFPERFVPFKNVIKRLEIGLEGRNLWLIKSYAPHVDPELSYFGAGSVGGGVEFNSFPSTSSYGVNLKIKF